MFYSAALMVVAMLAVTLAAGVRRFPGGVSAGVQAVRLAATKRYAAVALSGRPANPLRRRIAHHRRGVGKASVRRTCEHQRRR